MNLTSSVRIITISREFGAGGRLVGERLAELLGWKLWDKELVREVARVSGIPERGLADLDEHEARPSLWARLQGRPSHRAYLAALKEWMDQIAEDGNAVVIGRGAAVLMRYRAGALHLRLTAPLPVRARRVQGLDASLDESAAAARCRQMDEQRARYVKHFFGEDVANPLAYHATINTGALSPEATATLLANVVKQPDDPARQAPARNEPGEPPRVLTLTSELGSRETDLGRELARRLGLTLWAPEDLDREAGLPPVSDPDLREFDPQGVSALRKVVVELGRRGGVLVVGRGGSEFLRDSPTALHVKLIAPLAERVRRVMEYRWVLEKAAQATVAECDARRRAFFEKSFGVSWSDPLRFDMVLNTAALGPHTADLIVEAARLKWSGQAAAAVAGSATGDTAR
jgi:cytidylate kinase